MSLESESILDLVEGTQQPILVQQPDGKLVQVLNLDSSDSLFLPQQDHNILYDTDTLLYVETNAKRQSLKYVLFLVCQIRSFRHRRRKLSASNSTICSKTKAS